MGAAMGRPKKKEVPGGEVQTAFRIPVDVHMGLRMIALSRGVPMNTVAIDAFRRLLKADFDEVNSYIAVWQRAGKKGHLFELPDKEKAR